MPSIGLFAETGSYTHPVWQTYFHDVIIVILLILRFIRSVFQRIRQKDKELISQLN